MCRFEIPVLGKKKLDCRFKVSLGLIERFSILKKMPYI